MVWYCNKWLWVTWCLGPHVNDLKWCCLHSSAQPGGIGDGLLSQTAPVSFWRALSVPSLSDLWYCSSRPWRPPGGATSQPPLSSPRLRRSPAASLHVVSSAAESHWPTAACSSGSDAVSWGGAIGRMRSLGANRWAPSWSCSCRPRRSRCPRCRADWSHCPRPIGRCCRCGRPWGRCWPMGSHRKARCHFAFDNLKILTCKSVRGKWC